MAGYVIRCRLSFSSRHCSIQAIVLGNRPSLLIDAACRREDPVCHALGCGRRWSPGFCSNHPRSWACSSDVGYGPAWSGVSTKKNAAEDGSGHGDATRHSGPASAACSASCACACITSCCSPCGERWGSVTTSQERGEEGLSKHRFRGP